MKKAMVWVVVFVCVCGTARALINPNFTPLDLVEQADVVMVGVLGPGAVERTWALGGGKVIKGEAAVKQVLDLAGCKADQAMDIGKILTANLKQPLILFSGTMEEQKRAYMHVTGVWLEAAAGDGNTWHIKGYASNMSATYAGGTPSLVRMSEYLVADPDADVRVSAGVAWSDEDIAVGTVAGQSAGMAAVEIGTDRKLHLYVSSSEGDKLFRPETDKDAYETTFKDVTAGSGLKTASRAFLWTDVNGDGAADLVSSDGTTLSVHLAAADGTFKPAGDGWSMPLAGGCLGLTPCSTDGSAGILASTFRSPILLQADGLQGWKKIPLPGAETGVGAVAPCAVADFDQDGYGDILQPGLEAGMFWRGKAGGFHEPKQTEVATGPGGARIAMGDFNEDGAMDLFLAGRQKNSIWQNSGNATFTEVFRFSGSVSYKCPPGATDVQAMDLNHDGRTDVALVYADKGILYHFNRGFRSFGEEGEVALRGLSPEPGQPAKGQVAMSVGDYNGDASQDLVVLTTDGKLFCYLNDMYDVPVARLRLPKGVTGPVTVSCWQGDEHVACVGVAVVNGASPAAVVPARFAGEMTLKWRDAEGEHIRKVRLEDSALDVVIKDK